LDWHSLPPSALLILDARVNPQILIDAIVRQTMVLIAQVSTVDGVRSPLSHVADEVFMGLVRELERQRVGKKVIADMFGLALRSYQQKVQRLSESATTRGVTLWSAIHDFLSGRESASRAELLAHFADDEERVVRSILNDLVESGLVCRSASGKEARYRVATAEELEELGATGSANSLETNAALVWVHVYRSSPLRRDELARLLPLPAPVLGAAIDSLVADERIRLETRGDGVYCVTHRCLIPVGQAAGWEAALIDHHRAVLSALAAKVVSGKHVSRASDEVGGTTVSFDLWPGHPREAEVRALLAASREQIIPLWNEVAEYNRQHRPDKTYKVTYYCGQYLLGEEDGS
jgi:hypothetical protein